MTTRRRGPASNLTIYVFLLALGTLIHKTQLWEGLSEPLPMITTALCVALLFKPDTPRLLLLLAVATLAEATWYAPFYFLNHMVYVAFMCFGVIGTVATVYAREKRLPRSLAEIEPLLFPLLRAGFYGMFVFVVLGKSNHAFFDPSTSCAVEHYFNRLLPRASWAPDLESLRNTPVLPVFAFLTEASIPILVFFKRTRQLGLFVAVGFHYIMAINGYQGFSAYAPALYVPFLSPELHRSVAAAYRVLEKRLHGALLRRITLTGVAVFAAAMTMAHAADRTYVMAKIGLVWYLVVHPSLYLFYLWLVLRRRRRPPRPWPSGIPKLAWQWALLALLALQSSLPYLGFKTHAVFTMYSNLQTEKGKWNHLFLPEWLRVGGFQDSLITVTAVSGMTLLRPWERDHLPGLVAAGRSVVTRFELKRQIAAHCRAGQAPIRLSYRIGDKDYELADACQDPDLSVANSWLLEKAFWFRPVPRKSVCIH